MRDPYLYDGELVLKNKLDIHQQDSGYDDAYKQTSDYLDWFEKADISKGKKVYGIICLNLPSKEMIAKVHSDSRLKMFEYQILILKYKIGRCYDDCK